MLQTSCALRQGRKSLRTSSLLRWHFQIQILETLDLYSLMILFLFSSYHLSVSDTSAARTPTAVAAAPTGLTLFSSSLLLLLHTLYRQQLREKRVRARRSSSSSSSRTTCRSLTIQLLLQALALPPFLPSFPKTFSTPSDQSSIYVAGEHRWPDQSVEENLPVLKMQLQIV